MIRRFVIAVLVAVLLAATVPVLVRAADEDCRTSVCDVYSNPWEFFYWVFRCYLPRCPEIIVTLPPWERGGRS